MFTFITHLEENKILQQQLPHIDFAVRLSSRAVRIFPALPLRHVQPSYRTLFLMVFQGNCEQGHTGHKINSDIDHQSMYRVVSRFKN